MPCTGTLTWVVVRMSFGEMINSNVQHSSSMPTSQSFDCGGTSPIFKYFAMQTNHHYLTKLLRVGLGSSRKFPSRQGPEPRDQANLVASLRP
ncbi:hypothetical protein PAXRUDRAFT_277821 [Paxillus rubicundulus Ve08.2h10]|uniref:Uncharacterized protein n=1 Tax=Paxillus rubicundulus Ve08.2h10 TaxID=930991 RepID=A0A0D0CVL8_9AGAM|nr:hypothetical protein PAXRUDRAFT_277821 [Paxillus rubicundulus Ve08.2h10]